MAATQLIRMLHNIIHYIRKGLVPKAFSDWRIRSGADNTRAPEGLRSYSQLPPHLRNPPPPPHRGSYDENHFDILSRSFQTLQN